MVNNIDVIFYGGYGEINMEKRSEKLTKNQEETLWLLCRWMGESKKKTATYQELCTLFNRSLAPVYYMLNQLRRKGYIKRQGGKHGTEIKILKRIGQAELIEIPIVGTVCNDLPMLFYDPIGMVKIPPAIAEGREVFAMKLIQDSPEEEAVIFFREWQLPTQANIVLLEHNGRLVIRKIKITKTELLLAPRTAPDDYVKVLPDDSLRFIAILLSVHRNGELDYE